MMAGHGHVPGDPLECYGIPVVLHKQAEVNEYGQPVCDSEGKPRYRCGFRVGGGIDQDPSLSPQGYPDKGIYVTFIYEDSPARQAGLQVHDKILQVNGHDLTVVTHKKAVEYIGRKTVLNLIIYRKGVPQLYQQKITASSTTRQPASYDYSQPHVPQQQLQSAYQSQPAYPPVLSGDRNMQYAQQLQYPSQPQASYVQSNRTYAK